MVTAFSPTRLSSSVADCRLLKDLETSELVEVAAVTFDEPDSEGIVEYNQHIALLAIHFSVNIHQLALLIGQVIAGQHFLIGLPAVYFVRFMKVHHINYASFRVVVNVHHGVIQFDSQQNDLLGNRLEDILDFIDALVCGEEIQFRVDGLAAKQCFSSEASSQLELLNSTAKRINQKILPSVQHYQQYFFACEAERQDAVITDERDLSQKLALMGEERNVVLKFIRNGLFGVHIPIS